MNINILCCCCKTKNKRLIDHDIMTHIDKVQEECALCLESIISEPCIHMDFCYHIFHYSCIQKYISNIKRNKQKQFLCPLCLSNQTELYNEFINN